MRFVIAQPPTSKIKALVFDFDGTLADTFPIFVHAVEYALGSRPFSHEEIENLRQYSAREVINILKIKKWKLPWVVSKGMREVDRYRNDIPIFKDVSSMLRLLSEQGYKLYVVSSHSEKGIRSTLKRYALDKTFDRIYGNVGLFGKTRTLRKLQRRFAYKAYECVFIGDEIRDIEAAKKAGVRCIAVSWGFNSLKSLREHSPNATIDEPLELIKVLEDLS